MSIRGIVYEKKSLGHWALASWYDNKGYWPSVQTQTMHTKN